MNKSIPHFLYNSFSEKLYKIKYFWLEHWKNKLAYQQLHGNIIAYLLGLLKIKSNNFETYNKCQFSKIYFWSALFGMEGYQNHCQSFGINLHFFFFFFTTLFRYWTDFSSMKKCFGSIQLSNHVGISLYQFWKVKSKQPNVSNL